MCSHLACVFHHFPVVYVGGSAVPVHHDDVHVAALQEERHELCEPDGRRAGGPVAVDEEGARRAEVEARVSEGLSVGQQLSAGHIGPCVQQ